MTETKPPPDLGSSFEKALIGKSEAPALSDSIKKTAPKQSFEMPGPLGARIRKLVAQEQFSQDYNQSNISRAKKFDDKSKQGLVLSKEDVVAQTKGLLGQQFENAKSKGKDL